MTVQSVDKRERRRLRELRKLNEFKYQLKYLKEPVQALHWTRSLTATWDAVRRIASVEMSYGIQDIGLAWRIVEYVKRLPDGKERLASATARAIQLWEAEVGE